MNREQVMDLMREAGAGYEHPRPKDYAGVVDVFVNFATLVAAAEREACAKVCEEAKAGIWPYSDAVVRETGGTVCDNLAKQIRARNTNKETK